MAGRPGLPACLALALLCLVPLLSSVAADASHQVFVVHLGSKCDKHESEIVAEHHDLLASVMGSVEVARDAILYHYHRSFRGFSAKMAPHHADALKECDKVHSVFPSKSHFPHSTHSWQFLGVSGNDTSNLLTGTAFEYPSFAAQNNVIIGVLDSGYWPESASFHGLDMPPPPARWLGACVAGQNFTADTCNNKVIGAKYYYKGAEAQLNGSAIQDLLSARDIDGHGTHTASTAGGRNVSGVSYYGIAGGNIVGGAPGARLAIYKVCIEGAGCTDADMLAAFDDAIADGVDIISISIATSTGDEEGTHFSDGLAVGSYYAATHNVLVSAAAGNNGPSSVTVANTAPWILTVASSTTDRQLVTNVQLGDGSIIPGGWVANPFSFPADAPIVAGANAPAATSSDLLSSFCAEGSLDRSLVAGAIVACQYDPQVSAESEVIAAGGAGLILIGTPSGPRQFSLPATFVTEEAANAANAYFAATPNPVGQILLTETLYGQQAPVVSTFSSRGPSFRNPDILKPDITGPGHDILAAYSPLALGSSTGGRSVNWNIISGTSMATPHLAGIAALIKAVHPDWSPSAIKSAIMTSAYVVDNSGNSTIRTYPTLAPGGPLDFGSGHPRPGSALDPGLLYDTDPAQYIDFLCGYGITALQLQQFTGVAGAACPPTPIPHHDINYPSISLSHLAGTVTVYRTVTNVGPLPAVQYTATVQAPLNVAVTVNPPVLNFTALGQKLQFTVTFQVTGVVDGSFYYWGSLTWSDGVHAVRSPLFVRPYPV